MTFVFQVDPPNIVSRDVATGRVGTPYSLRWLQQVVRAVRLGVLEGIVPAVVDALSETGLLSGMRSPCRRPVFVTGTTWRSGSTNTFLLPSLRLGVAGHLIRLKSRPVLWTDGAGVY
jgi:hypothetical protein